eukprot:scaffold2236_cov385-Prasinococcus_capsulatus_cf.AAC.6
MTPSPAYDPPASSHWIAGPTKHASTLAPVESTCRQHVVDALRMQYGRELEQRAAHLLSDIIGEVTVVRWSHARKRRQVPGVQSGHLDVHVEVWNTRASHPTIDADLMQHLLQLRVEGAKHSLANRPDHSIDSAEACAVCLEHKHQCWEEELNLHNVHDAEGRRAKGHVEGRDIVPDSLEDRHPSEVVAGQVAEARLREGHKVRVSPASAAGAAVRVVHHLELALFSDVWVLTATVAETATNFLALALSKVEAPIACAACSRRIVGAFHNRVQASRSITVVLAHEPLLACEL